MPRVLGTEGAVVLAGEVEAGVEDEEEVLLASGVFLETSGEDSDLTKQILWRNRRNSRERHQKAKLR